MACLTPPVFCVRPRSKNELRKLTEEEELQDTGVTLLFHDLWRVCAVAWLDRTSTIRQLALLSCCDVLQGASGVAACRFARRSKRATCFRLVLYFEGPE